MRRRTNMRAIHLLIIQLCVLTLALPAWAQWGIMDEEVPADHRGDDDGDDDEEEEKDEDEDQWDDDEEEEEEQKEDEWDNGEGAEDEEEDEEDEESEDEGDGKKDKGLKEDPEDKLFYLGARLRWIMIPEWFIRMFGVDAKQHERYRTSLPLVSNVGAGAEFIYRKDRFDITAAIWYAGLGWDPISLKQRSEPDYSYEVVENTMRSILFTADFIWSTSFLDWFAITYGLGVGFGVRWGDIVRTEASEESDYFEKCEGPNSETGANDRGCAADSDGDYGEYGVTYEKFKVFPWLEFLFGFRFKPHEHVAIYVDGGFGLGFQLGLRSGYIF